MHSGKGAMRLSNSHVTPVIIGTPSTSNLILCLDQPSPSTTMEFEDNKVEPEEEQLAVEWRMAFPFPPTVLVIVDPVRHKILVVRDFASKTFKLFRQCRYRKGDVEKSASQSEIERILGKMMDAFPAGTLPLAETFTMHCYKKDGRRERVQFRAGMFDS